jgi:hypothetical protein
MIEFVTDERNFTEHQRKNNFRPHGKFTSEEDQILRTLVQAARTPDWQRIATSLTNRTPRQCKERWAKYLDPNISSNDWTEDEDEILRHKFDEFGSRWIKIATFLPSRTDYMVKNRFAKLQRKDNKKNGKRCRKQNSMCEWSTSPLLEPVVEVDLPLVDPSMLDGALGDVFMCGNEPWDMCM